MDGFEMLIWFAVCYIINSYGQLGRILARLIQNTSLHTTCSCDVVAFILHVAVTA